jgi:predicted metalloprotease
MEWGGGRREGNIEDRRGLGPVGVAGGGIGAVVLAVIGYFVFGDPSRDDDERRQRRPAARRPGGVRGQVSDREGQFVDVIETSNTDVWTPLLANTA